MGAARAGRLDHFQPAGRALANYARLAALIGEARVKEAILTAGEIDGLATEVVDDAEARVTELCDLPAGHSAVTMRVTKEALRRLRPLPDGDDLVREAYFSEELRARVQAFLQR